jgi:hypothetical protein
MGTVADAVEVVLGGEVVPGGHLAGEVRVGVVDAGVEHRDRDAGTGEAGLVRDGSADLRHARFEGGLAEPVEPDPSSFAVLGGSRWWV